MYLYFNICVASLQNRPLVGRNESGIIPDSNKLFCLLISILIHIVFYISTAVICNKTFLNVIIFTNFVQQLWYFFYNELIKTGLELTKIDERNR